ncbi:hypothetical protein GGI04_001408, partial [Coemansia thaxteri]
KFAPPLHDNQVIECKLGGNMVIVHVYFLKYRRGTRNTGLLDAFKKEAVAGHMFVHNGRLAEVRQELVFQAPLKSMDHDLNCLDQATCLLVDVVGQLHAFDSL